MKIIYAVRTGLHIYPPCLAQIFYLRDLGYDVLAIYGDCNCKTERLLRESGVSIYNLGVKRSAIKILGKIQSYTLYKKRFLKALKSFYRPGDLIWYGTVDSCFSLGRDMNKYPYLLNVLELYETKTFYGRESAKAMRYASAIIACEQTRADIMKIWYGLSKRPYVMPNKPYGFTQLTRDGSTDQTKSIIKQMGGRKVFLYQGIISADRNLKFIAEALNKMDDPEIYLGVMGAELCHSVEELKRIYPRTLYFGYVPAPYHMEITSNSFAGIAYYEGSSLNNLFCAPNKIYEYSGQGLPIICNDVPGLRDTVGRFHAGECVDFENKEELIEAIRKILLRKQDYLQGAQNMFNFVDNKAKTEKILSDVLETQRKQ